MLHVAGKLRRRKPPPATTRTRLQQTREGEKVVTEDEEASQGQPNECEEKLREMVKGRGACDLRKEKEGLTVLCQKGGLGRVWHAFTWSEMDYFIPEVTIMSSFNLKPLKPASNLLNLQNILSFTIPSYFKLFNFLINYMHINYSKFPNIPKNHQKFLKIPKFPNFSIYHFLKHSLILY